MLRTHEPSVNMLDLLDILPSKGEYVSDYLKKMCNKRNIIFTNKGRDALYICLKNIGVKKDDEIIMPAYTSKIVKKTISSLCKAVMVDIDIKTLNIDIGKIEKAITRNTKAIVIVHSFGNPSKIDEIMEIAKRHSLITIEDCAQSLGSRYKGKFVGYFGDYSFFAFGYAKDLALFKGGAFLSNNNIDYNLKKREYLKSIMQNFSVLFGMYVIENLPKFIRDLMTTMLVRPYVINNMEVFKFNDETISGYDMALLTKQFRKLEYILKKRREFAARYAQFLTERAHTQKIEKNARSNYFRYALLVDKKRKKEIRKILGSQGIMLAEMYNYYNSQPGTCRFAEQASVEMLHLPCHFRMTKAQQDKVIKVVNLVLDKPR